MNPESQRRKIICLTPIKNEAWILETFLRCASVWADHIVVADQGSTDGSREIASKFEKVILVDNPSPTFNEPERIQLLLRAARMISGPRLLVALDADEVLVGDLDRLRSPAVAELRPGSHLSFEWVNVHPDRPVVWSSTLPMAWGYVDDGRELSTSLAIHSGRLPTSADATIVPQVDLKILHLQYLDWSRMRSKHRWYQCYERIQFPDKSPVAIHRLYHHMDSALERASTPFDPSWIEAYHRCGIDPLAHRKEGVYRWDSEVVEMVRLHGARKFRYLDIWDGLGLEAHVQPGGAAAGILARTVRTYLHASQRWSRSLPVRAADKALAVVLRESLSVNRTSFRPQ